MDDDLNFIAEIQDEFLDESSGFLEKTECRFLDLKTDPNDISIIEDILCLAHNIKGSAAAVGFNDFSAFSNRFENLLVKVKQKELMVTSGIIDLMIASNDVLKQFITSLQADKNSQVDTAEIDRKLEEMMSSKSPEENMAQIDSLIDESEKQRALVKKII